MTISSNQELLFDPSDIVSSDDYESSNVGLSEDGTWLAMGTPFHELDLSGLNPIVEAGACYILKKVNGVYIQKQKLIDTNRLINNQFGSRVWMSAYGRRLFVASHNDSNSVANGGSVFVYDLDETNDVWNFNFKLEVPSGPVANSKFGWSIMSDFYGQLLVVGSPFEDNGGTLRGAGYLFKDNGVTFSQLNKFSYSKALDSSRLGYSVAISGDGNVVFMGMTLLDLSGSVGVFKKNNSGIFPSTESSIVRDANGLTNDYFSVAIETLNTSVGNSLVVDHEGRNLYIGAHNKLDNSGVRGAVFRFTGDVDYNYTIKETILQRKGRTLDTDTLLAKFGFSLAIDKFGKMLVVGAPDDAEIQSGSGAIYVYKRDVSLDTYAIKVKKDDPIIDDHNGRSVALSSDASVFISSTDNKEI